MGELKAVHRKVVIGAGRASFDGWSSTQEEELNLLCRADFERLFSDNPPAAFLAEHVWEHLTYEEGCQAAKNCYDYLEEGGYLRVAVPDKNFRNAWYQDVVKVGGNGDPNHPSFTHKIVYDYRTFAQVFQQAGFEVELLEWCDENGCFHCKYWNPEDGMIGRSLRFDTRNRNGKLGMVSIILDAKKVKRICPEESF